MAKNKRTDKIDVTDKEMHKFMKDLLDFMRNEKKYNDLMKYGKTPKQKRDAADAKKDKQEERKSALQKYREFRANHQSYADLNRSVSKLIQFEKRKAGAQRMFSGKPDKGTMDNFSDKKLSAFSQFANRLKGFKQLLKPGGGGKKKEGEQQENSVAKGMKSMLKFAVGGSIVTMLAKRLFDSSPLLKAMMSLFNTSLMLIFRPIGDMIGGFFRPIMLFFMRNIAIPFYKENKHLMNMGKMAGKEFLNFMINPAMFIGNAIVGVKNDHEKFLVSWWMGQKNKKAGRNYTREEAMALVAKSGEGAVGGVSNIRGGITYEGQVREQEAQINNQETMTDNTETMVNESTIQVENSKIITSSVENVRDDFGLIDSYVGGQGGIVTSVESTANAWEAIANLFNDLKKSLEAALNKTAAQKSSVGKDTKKEDKLKNVVGSVPSFGWGLGTAWDPKNPGDIHNNMLKYGKSEWVTTGSQANNKVIQARIAALTESQNEWNKKAAEAGLNKSLADHKFWDNVSNIYATMGINAKSANIVNGLMDSMIKRNFITKTIKDDKTGEWVTSITSKHHSSAEAQRILNDVELAKQLGTVGFGSQDAKRAELVGMANGGIINEPIFGIGASGKRYSFGERGAETVTPGVGGSNVININIGNVSRDADFDKLKPLIQRWLLESHSRRGLI